MEAAVVTILNKLPRKDSLTGLDIWYKTVLHNIQYKTHKVTNINGTTVSLGQTFTILLPFNDLYLDYEVWKDAPDTGYTISPGDYIFLNTELTETITPSNIQSIKNQYEPNVCEVRTILQVPKKTPVRYQFSIEGV